MVDLIDSWVHVGAHNNPRCSNGFKRIQFVISDRKIMVFYTFRSIENDMFGKKSLKIVKILLSHFHAV